MDGTPELPPRTASQATPRPRGQSGSSPLPAPAPANPRSAPPPMSYWARATLTVVAVLFGLYLVYALRSVVVSVLLGLFLAVGLEPAIAALIRRGLPRGLAIFTLIAAVVGGLALFLVLAIPPVVTQFAGLVANLPSYFDELARNYPQVSRFVNGQSLQQQLGALLERIPDLITASFGRVVEVIGLILGGVFSVLTVLVLMIYFMLALPKLRDAARRQLRRPERVEIFDTVLSKISAYVVGQLIICLVSGIAHFAFFAAIRAPFPALLALMTGVMAAIPLVGATLAAVLSVLIVLTDSLGKAVAVAIFAVIYQQIETYLLGPRVYARAINLPAAVVFLAVLCGASLAGLVGALVALPLAAAVKAALQREGLDTPPEQEPVGPPAAREGGRSG